MKWNLIWARNCINVKEVRGKTKIENGEMMTWRKLLSSDKALGWIKKSSHIRLNKGFYKQ